MWVINEVAIGLAVKVAYEVIETGGHGRHGGKAGGVVERWKGGLVCGVWETGAETGVIGETVAETGAGCSW